MRKSFVAALVLGIGALTFAEDGSRLVVHEWGTFTSISGDDGVALEYRPLTGVSDLPSFVYTGPTDESLRGTIWGKCAINGNVRMETPVIYFYSPREQKVSVKVSFPKGKITEFYPRANEVQDGMIDWGTFLVKPKECALLPGDSTENHYFRARETDSDILRVCAREQKTQYEKFLFYRGVGTFPLPVKVTLRDEGKTVHMTGLTGPVIVFENRKGEKRFTVVTPGCKSQSAEASRPETARSQDELEAELVRMLTGEGLYEKEAKAMVATWRNTWFEEGLRVFYVLPRTKTDEILPLKIEPTPAQLVRVLVGRAEVITPEREAELLETVSNLGSEKFEEREAAQKVLAREGRFVRPILQRALEKTRDAEVVARIHELLEK
ncbi:MAG TPA: hypothetical protein VFF73_02540 [Planctomycetota bacterium]|nr:hypothetical protein [Planctomycetota bacterium]